MSDYLQKLIRSNPLRLPVIRDIIDYLKLPKESKGIDVGCGYGAQMLLFAKELGKNSRITGIDLSSEFLDYGKKIIESEGLSEQIIFKKGNMNNLPFENNSFDWGWSMDCVGYHPSDPRSAIKELIRIIKPGGTINLLAWSSEMLLPGHPLLEAKLNATSVGIAPFSKGKNPKKHFLRLINRFQDLGLDAIEGHTFVGTVYAPLKEDIYNAMIDLLEMRWDGAESELSKEEQKEFNRLCLPNSPDFILNLPDYYAFFTYSLFRGKVNK
jgi:demethylmenaquinone methyltransferase/2-methoxy-6-polyprenyl-1,4-benzoquinol methylase